VALDFVLIIGLVAWLLGQALAGKISPEVTAVCLIALVFLVALARSQQSRVAFLVFRVGLPIASMCVAIIAYGNGDFNSVSGIAASIGALVLALFGFYLIFRAVLSRGR